jgi:hypothetical protein
MWFIVKKIARVYVTGHKVIQAIPAGHLRQLFPENKDTIFRNGSDRKYIIQLHISLVKNIRTTLINSDNSSVFKPV